MPSVRSIALTGIQDAQFDPDALAFISAAAIEDTVSRYAINNLVTDLKLNGIWTKLQAVYPFAGSSASSQKWNLKDPRDLDAAFRLEFYGGITHSSNGFAGNGTNGFADTNFNVTNLTQNDSHICFYQRFNYTPGTEIDMGAYNETAPGNGVFLAAEIVTGTTRGRMYRSAADYANTDQRGFFLITSTSDTRLFTNGVKRTTIANSGAFPLTSGNIYISAMNSLQTPAANYYTQGNYAWASIGTGLTDSEALTYNSIVQRYQNALSRAIVAIPTVQDIDAQNFLVATQITDSTQAQAVQNLTAGLKFNSLWSKIQAVYPFVGGTSTTQKFNLKSPFDTDTAFRLVFSGGITHNSNGITLNGTNGYGDTFYIPNTNGSQNDQHVSIYSRTNSATNVKDFGTQSGASNTLLLGIRTASPDFFGVSGVNSGADLALGLFPASTGLFVISRTVSASFKVFRDGVLAKTVSNVSAGRSTVKLLLGANNNNGTIGEYSARNYAFASVGTGLTDSEAANFYTVVQAYQTALSRNV